jgi:dTDP-4-dehydrorhamnose reductase
MTSGQLARELARAPWPSGWTVSFASPPEIDLGKPDEAAAAVTAAKPDIVVNAAAYTKVDQAESEPDVARVTNATGPAAVAAACASLNVPFITVSTDYVFDGAKPSPYVEDDPVNPISVYGRTKAEGEALIRTANPRHVILRTSWVFSPYGTNFVRTMMRLGAERRIVTVVADQHGRPTHAGDLAKAIVEICTTLQAGAGQYGTFHATNEGATTWHGFAVAIFQGLAARGERVPQQVAAITTAEYPTKAVRPANSVLDCTRLANTFGVALRPWRDALDECLSELIKRKSNVRV